MKLNFNEIKKIASSIYFIPIIDKTTHLLGLRPRNVVFFPSELEDLLMEQSDSDGTYWMAWDERLVKHFLKAENCEVMEGNNE